MFAVNRIHQIALVLFLSTGFGTVDYIWSRGQERL